jgi:hypothetical protein
MISEAGDALQRSEAASKKQLKLVSKNIRDSIRFPPGTLWELIHADAVILLGLTQALRSVPEVHHTYYQLHPFFSESYKGYLQCL